MRPRLVLRAVFLPLVLVTAAAVGGWWASGTSADNRSALTSALDALPADTQVAGFTDWSSIRKHLGLDGAGTEAVRAELTDEAAARDLSTRSVIGRSIEQMHGAYGWSAAETDWEVYGRTANGATLVVHLAGDVSVSAIRKRLGSIGYVRDGQTWSLGPSAKLDVSADLASTLASVAVLPRQRLVVASATRGGVAASLDVLEGDAPSLLSLRSAAGVAAALVGTDTALLQAGPSACGATAMDGLGADVDAQVRAATAGVAPLADVTFGGRALSDRTASRQEVRFALGFDSPAQAAGQLAARRSLATGPFIGRSGRIEDSLVLTGSSVEGSTMTLRFDHDPDSAVYMVGQGPILFASCALAG